MDMKKRMLKSRVVTVAISAAVFVMVNATAALAIKPPSPPGLP